MALEHATKAVFEEAVRVLLKTNNLKNITVNDIVKEANTTRTTFYRHFKDKYDLIAWIYMRKTDSIIEQFPGITWREVIVSLFEEMNRDRAFYLSVMADSEQNALVNYMVDYDVNAYKQMFAKYRQDLAMDDQLVFDINFHAFACVHMTQLWALKTKDRESPEELAQKLLNAMPRHLFESIPNRGI